MRFDPSKKLTSRDIQGATPDDINQYWLDRQAWHRANGTSYYTHLIVPATGEVALVLPSHESRSSLESAERAWARKGGE